MNYIKKITLTNFFLMISILICSCGATHHLRDDYIYQDDDFAYNHLMNKGMIIGGISSEILDLDPEERIKYSSILSNILLEKLEDVHNIHIVSTVQLLNEIGKENYFEIMDNFDTAKVFNKIDLQLVRDSIPNTEYILFAYIENENIIESEFEQEEEEEEGESITTDYERTYLLTVDFQLYDIVEEILVWNNVIYNEAKKSESRSTRSGCFESVIDALIACILLGDPAEIDREEVLAKIIEKFVENLVETKI